jgi:hypothetical protein
MEYLDTDREILLEHGLKSIGRMWMDLFGLRKGSVAGSCEKSFEFVKDRDCLHGFNEYPLLKNVSVPRIIFFFFFVLLL